MHVYNKITLLYSRNQHNIENQLYFNKKILSLYNKCWGECGEKETLLHCWWKCKLAQPPWRTLWRFLKTKNRVELVEEGYESSDYFNKIKGLEELGEGSKRCFECYKFRMEKGANYAKEHNFDYFTTTLSISPYKNSIWINQIGEYLEHKYNIKYLFCDLKKKNGFKRSLELSKIYGLYRQDYCGCIYSKQEREKVTHESV